MLVVAALSSPASIGAFDSRGADHQNAVRPFLPISIFHTRLMLDHNVSALFLYIGIPKDQTELLMFSEHALEVAETTTTMALFVEAISTEINLQHPAINIHSVSAG